MNLIFRYPDNFESLGIFLATRAYEAIWQDDGAKIQERFEQYTGLRFQQNEIEVLVHDGQSMSGMNGVPMRLNVRNDTIVKKQNALTHELAHRLLFGNGLYAPDNSDPTDNDEIRVLLFQGNVMRDLYGESAYLFWADLSPNDHTKAHIKDMSYVLSLSAEDRSKNIKQLYS